MKSVCCRVEKRPFAKGLLGPDLDLEEISVDILEHNRKFVGEALQTLGLSALWRIRRNESFKFLQLSKRISRIES
jgi:hypothetical protein